MTEHAYAHTGGFWCGDCHPEPGFMSEECQQEECSGDIIPELDARCVSCSARWTGTEWVEANPLCECGCKQESGVWIYRLATGTRHYYVLGHIPRYVEAITAEALMESS